MFLGANGSPTKGNGQKRVREPTGSSGPESESYPGNISESVGMALWRPGVLPAVHHEQSQEDGATHGFAHGTFQSELLARSASHSGGETSPLRVDRQTNPQSSTAFPLPTSPLSPLATMSNPQEKTAATGPASAPAASLGVSDASGGSLRAEQSLGSFQGQMKHQQPQSLSSPPQSVRSVSSNTNKAPLALKSPLANVAAATAAGNGPINAAAPVAAVGAVRASHDEDSEGSRASSCSSDTPAKSAESSPSPAPSSSSSSSSDDDESDTNEQSERGMREDRLKRYPRFTTDYAAKCKGDLVPFLREWFVPLPSATPSYRDPMGPFNDVTYTQQPSRRQLVSRFVLYGKYVYQRTLGKGTYSKVVLAEELSHSPAVQQEQLLTGGSGGNSPTPGGGADGIAVEVQAPHGGVGGPQVALKIFRDSDVYREACWDEYNILSALCNAACGNGASALSSAAPQLLTTVRTAPGHTGVMEYYGNVGRFMTPIDYIPHPLHPAVVYPVMGPSLLHVVRSIKKASKDLSAATRRASSFSPTTQGGRFVVKRSGANSPTTPSHGRNRVWFRGLPLPLFKVALYQILLFLRFTHARGLVHTDLKPENILFETNIALPTPVGVFYKSLERNRNGNGPTSTSPTGSSSLEMKKNMNDAHKLTSATSNVKLMAGQFPSAPSEDGLSQKSSPRTQHKGGADGSALHHAHTVTARIPLLNSIRVVDLGAAQFQSTFTHKSHIDGVTPVSYDPIQTSHYRSPETLMGTGWNASADIFSLGCMIPELLTGDCLFMPQDTQEHLALMQHIIGPFWSGEGGSIERVFTINARTFLHYFDQETNELKWPVTEEILKDYERQQAGNEERDGIDEEAEPPLDPFKLTTEDDEAFVFDKPTLQEILGDYPLLLDLCQRMLRYNPFDRITAEDALAHPFFHTS